MRLVRLYLKNYMNIYNALGRYEINIDFTKCKNKVLVIRSENGAGKTSIINELHPFFSHPSVFMLDKDVTKIIEFALNDGTLLSIVYTGYKAKDTRPKPSKCYIKRIYPDGQSFDLNPNGNMSSGKDIITSLLDINDDYMMLSGISANSKGIGAMKPAERRRFLSLIIRSLDPFIKMNKLFTQKYSILKSMMSSLNTKISMLGNIEVIKSTAEKQEKELKTIEKKKETLSESITTLTTTLNILTKDGNPNEIYNKCLAERSSIELDIKDIPEDVLNFDENQILVHEKEDSKLEAKIETLEQQLSTIVDKETSVRSSLESNTVKLKSLFDESILQSTKKRLEDSEKALQFYKNCFETLGFYQYTNITEQEYQFAINTIEMFNNSVYTIGDAYTPGIIEEASKYINRDFKETDYNILIESLKNKLESVKEDIREQNNLKVRSSEYENIPSDCKHLDDCPFITSIVQSRNQMVSIDDYNRLVTNRDSLISSLEEATKMMEKQSILSRCISDIKYIIKLIESARTLLTKFPNTDILSNNTHIIDCLIHTKSIKLDISKYKEYTNYITLISTTQKDIEAYKEKIKTLMNSSKESWQLQQLIEKESNELNEIMSSKVALNGKIRELKNAKNVVKSTLVSLYTAKDLKTRYEAFSEKLREINTKISSLAEDARKYQDLVDQITKLNTEKDNLNTTVLPELKNSIEKCKYQIILFDQYKKDYEYYSYLWSRLEIAKHDSSVNGIQADIMDVVMMEMVNTINQLAMMMFGGRFMLMKFEIGDEFNIPVLDKETGMTRPDISMMSNSQLSQLSMLISFVLLHNSSKKYNIIRLDEVDNNLDNDNRLQFFNWVNMIMDILHFDQCVMISHNQEVDLSNCDMIITRVDNPEFYRYLRNSGANIIADFMKG